MKRRIASLAALCLVVAACGGGGGGDDSSNDRRDRDEEEEVTDDTDAEESDRDDSGGSGVINDKQDVSRAVVRIEAQGTFRDPEFGQQAFTGTGSGFIISPDGLVVTNQHVVDGAGSLEVYIEGEDRPKNARILGVSECNDLAVLDLSGEDYPYLDWYRDEAEPGLDAWAAGYPLGDPEYSLSRGSVVKSEADGDTSWASVEFTIEHDANIQPGNSGGPLVSDEGRVIGVNYANGDYGTGTSQFFAIPASIAKDIIDVLAEGQDQDSIGVNGFAVATEDIAGVWVSGVRAGSPASNLGLKAGDIILELGGREVVTESDINEFGASKAGYCDVLRTQGTDKAIAVRVLRFDTGEILTGELNNPSRPLEVEASISGAITDGEATGDLYQYELMTDDTGAMELEVPTTWTDRITSTWTFLGASFPRVDVSSDLDSYFSTWRTSGLTVIAAPGLDDSNFIGTLQFFDASSQCDYLTAENFDNGDLYGIYDVYTDCGGVNGSFYVVSAFYDAFFDAMVIVLAYAVDGVDLEVIDRVLETVFLPL